MNSVYIIYNWFSPAYKAGGPIKSLANIASHLKNDISIKVICSNKDYDGTGLNLPANSWLSKDGISIFYSEKNFFHLRKQIDKNVFFINGIYSLNYSFLPALFLKGRKIVSVRGMLHPGALSQKALKKKIFLLLWKALGLHRKCEYHATTLEEKTYIQATLGKNCRVWVIPNLPEVLNYQKLLFKRKGNLVLCTVALISPMKNHLMVLESLLHCPANITYHIYGPVKDSFYWEKCKKIMSSLPPNVVVKYHGEVHPSLISEAIAKCHVYIQPSKSENFGHSLFEALTAGRPIITSSFTPWLELERCNAGINASIEDKENILKAINFFSDMEIDELERWSKKAREYIQSKMNIEQMKKEYLAMFNS